MEIINTQIRLVLTEKRQRPLLTTSRLSDNKKQLLNEDYSLKEYCFEDIIRMIEIGAFEKFKILNRNDIPYNSKLYFNTLYVDKTIIKIFKANGCEVTEHKDYVYVDFKILYKKLTTQQ